MRVFSLCSAAHPATEIDLLLEPPIDFDKAYANLMQQELAPGINATFCGVEDLIAMKSLADRARDQQDIRTSPSFVSCTERISREPASRR